jgi:hypothetical protein
MDNYGTMVSRGAHLDNKAVIKKLRRYYGEKCAVTLHCWGRACMMRMEKLLGRLQKIYFLI